MPPAIRSATAPVSPVRLQNNHESFKFGAEDYILVLGWKLRSSENLCFGPAQILVLQRTLLILSRPISLTQRD